MNGKDRCNLLRTIRKDIAEQYGLEYHPTDCTQEGNCLGTCPLCDAELKDLQRQLKEKGIKNIDINESIQERCNEFEEENKDSDETDNPFERYPLEGIVPDFYDIEDDEDEEPIEQPTNKRKKVFFKECAIAGWTFHDPDDWWDELDEGMELALVREKRNRYDRNAIAVAFPEDYFGDPEIFDFDFILGYVPRAENELMAKMMDMGWSDAFTATLTTLKDHGSLDERLRMTIYIQSKDELEEGKELYAQKVSKETLQYITDKLYEKGFVNFRWGGPTPWLHDLPRKGNQVIFLHQTEEDATLYLMKLLASDADAAYFLDNPDEDLDIVDDCTVYILTNIQGPIICSNEQLKFLKDYPLPENQPEGKLSSEIAGEFSKLFSLDPMTYSNDVP